MLLLPLPSWNSSSAQPNIARYQISSLSPVTKFQLLPLVTKFQLLPPVFKFQPTTARYQIPATTSRYQIPATTARYQIPAYCLPLPNSSLLPPVTKFQQLPPVIKLQPTTTRYQIPATTTRYKIRFTARCQITAYCPLPNLRFLLLLQFLFLFLVWKAAGNSPFIFKSLGSRNRFINSTTTIVIHHRGESCYYYRYICMFFICRRVRKIELQSTV